MIKKQLISPPPPFHHPENCQIKSWKISRDSALRREERRGEREGRVGNGREGRGIYFGGSWVTEGERNLNLATSCGDKRRGSEVLVMLWKGERWRKVEET